LLRRSKKKRRKVPGYLEENRKAPHWGEIYEGRTHRKREHMGAVLKERGERLAFRRGGGKKRKKKVRKAARSPKGR